MKRSKLKDIFIKGVGQATWGVVSFHWPNTHTMRGACSGRSMSATQTRGWTLLTKIEEKRTHRRIVAVGTDTYYVFS